MSHVPFLRQTPGGAGEQGSVQVRICNGSGCVALGALDVLEELRGYSRSESIEIEGHPGPGIVGCRGFCSQGPLIHFPRVDLLYCKVTPEDVAEIVEKTLLESQVVEHLLYVDPVTGRRCRGLSDNPFFAGQERRVLARCGEVDPEEIDDAVALGAYEGLRHSVVGLDPIGVIDKVKRSGLQERGGAGFPVGLKWAVVAESRGKAKYVVGTGEGGDPGLTADRTLLEGDPHSLIEGMAIAGFAVGARTGRLYLSSEHGLGVARAERAVAQARRRGFLGSSILGTAFDFEIEICENAGASMGGEETALINTLQGRRGVARPRPPFPAVSGLWGCPTLINSLETLANIPLVVAPDQGRSGQTKIVAVSGAIARPGLVEVPLGTSVRNVIETIAGSGSDGEVVAAHLGGPAGATLGPEQFDTPIDFGSLRDHAANLGSGGLVVLGESDCPVALARFLVEFCAEESCGSCPPCRIGTRVVLNLLDRIGSGEGVATDLDQLESLCLHIRRTSMCEVGRNAATSVLTGLRSCRDVYVSHLSGSVCPSATCRSGPRGN